MFFVHVLSIKGEDLYCRKYCWCCKWSLDFTYSAVKLLLESGSFTLFNLYMLSTRCRMRKFVMCIITEPFELFELYVHDSYITSFQSFSINIFYQKCSFNVLSLIPNLQDRLFSSWKNTCIFMANFESDDNQITPNWLTDLLRTRSSYVADMREKVDFNAYSGK